VQGWTAPQRGVDCRKTKGTLGRGTDIRFFKGAPVQCSAVDHLTYIIGAMRAPKGAFFGAHQTGRAEFTRGSEAVTCPPSLFVSVSVERNGRTDSSGSEGLRSSLPPYSL